MMTTALQMHDVARANNAIDVVMVVPISSASLSSSSSFLGLIHQFGVLVVKKN